MGDVICLEGPESQEHLWIDSPEEKQNQWKPVMTSGAFNAIWKQACTE